MFSDKKNILQLVDLLRAHGVSQMVLCPGTRNAPIAQTLANHPDFTCRAITDERSAGFFAIGWALQCGMPVAVCCTSGTALLNLHPAVAEAFYQQIPLVVISADRPAAWIGQMDGQTIPQPNVFGSLVKKSINLPEILNEEDEWYCNRLINDALNETFHHGKGPVHINVPVSEPMFGMTAEKPPYVRIISRYSSFEDVEDLGLHLDYFDRQMLIIGQMPADCTLNEAEGKALSKRFAIFAEHTANLPHFIPCIRNFDAVLSKLPENRMKEMRPDLLITCGGNIVSKRLKQFLRSYPPAKHCHISENGEIIDLFGALTEVVEEEPYSFLEKMSALPFQPTDYPQQWKKISAKLKEKKYPYSEMAAIGALLKKLPQKSVLHLANSSPVRYAQLFSIPSDVEVYCNRGTSGIEGSLSTAVGFASASEKLNFAVIGDLSFFYDMNALWSKSVGNNLRILLLNNGGGEIFDIVSGLKLTEQTRRFVAGTHTASAKGWAVERGFRYTAIHNFDELNEALPVFTQTERTAQPMLLEVFTEPVERREHK